MRTLAISALLMTGLAAISPASAATLFLENFQDGDAEGWAPMGDGDVRITQYGQNRSLRLQKKAAALTAISTEGYENITVTISFAADSLEEGESCLGEVSPDGQTWVNVVTVGNGQDDAVSLHTGSIKVPEADNKAEIYIGVRIAGSRTDDSCWADNIRVSGRKIRDPALDGKRFSLDDLTGEQSIPQALDYAAYAPAGDAAEPSNRFEGRLVLGAPREGGGLDVSRDDYDYARTGDGVSLPRFDIAFVQDGDVIIPASRGLIGGEGDWDIIVDPGRVWDEPGDDGMTRAAIPFALQERNANCTHNGVMTFAFKNDGSISNVAYQIGAETCLYFKFDFWGASAATYTPEPVDGGDTIVATYEQEVANRLPVRPIAALADDHPRANPDRFGSPGEVDADYMTAFGLVYDGVHYVGGCETRYGPYPNCEVLALPSYSLAKTIFAGLGLMRLEMLYPGAKDSLIADYVPECADWGDITFENALDMATGRYRGHGFEEDEGSVGKRQFFLADTHKGRIEFACDHFPEKSRPGRKWVYHTSDTYLLGTAMAAYLRQHQPDADVYETLLVEPIWKALGLSPVTHTTRRSDDDIAQPFAGWGLTLHRDDIARIATFISNDEATLGGEMVVDQAMLDAALQKTGSDRGLQAGSTAYRYQNGFWAWNARDYLSCSRATWIPFMSGFGGLAVAMMPNGAVYYYVSDGGQFAWGQAAKGANDIAPFCND